MTIGNPIESHVVGTKTRLEDLRQRFESHITIKFNWAWILFFAFFLAYGYYGAVSPALASYKSDLLPSLGQLIIFVGIQFMFGYVAWKKSDRYRDAISIGVEEVFVFISFVLVFLVISHERLQYSLFSDEISYSGSAHGHSIYITLALANYLPVFGTATAQYMVQAISLTFLFTLVTLFIISARWTPQIRITVFLILLLLARMVFAVKGGNGSPHPPLHLLPLFITGSVFGINDVSFKLSYFIAYAGVLTLLYKMMRRVMTRSISYFSVLAFGTIPLLSYMSTVVEHSFWAFICFTLVFAEISTSPKLNYQRLISIISIAALMRQPTFLALIPIAILFIMETYRTGEIKRGIKESGMNFLPLLLFLPVLLSGLIHGTPSTDALGQGSMMERVKTAVESGVVWTSVANAIPVWWLLVMPFAFLPLSKKTINLNFGLFIFCVASIGVYYAINPHLWGYAKYQAEYAAPVAMAGLLFMVIRANQWMSARLVVLTFAIALLALNIRYLTNTPHLKEIEGHDLETQFDSVLEKKELKSLLAAVPYEYKRAYEAIKLAGLDGATYSIGATYGVLPEIMNGYSLGAVRSSYEIYVGQESNRIEAMKSGLSVEGVESDKRVKAVMIGAISGKLKLIDEFRQNGWEVMAEFKNIQYGTSVVIMKAPVAFSMSM